jgi:thiol-disulfide isomerase/thioredoxin|tara:strand:+ start:64630 stop:65838 length:1209 start_codon:yes stop_codon:yes gene_type:complete
MKNILLTTGLLLFCFASFGQDAKEILKQSYDKCQSVQNGYYEMTKYMKYMSEKDTSKTIFKCSFKKLKDDSLYSSAFHYKVFWNDTTSFEVMYTGDDFVTTSSKDSTATIMSKKVWAKEIKSYAHNYTFYSPLTNKKSSPLQHDSDFIDNQHLFKFIGQENLNGALCYHIQVNEIPENDSTEAMKTLRQEYQYWIKKEDMIPVQYSIAFDLVMNNDTMYQYEKIVLNKYEINNLKDENILTLNSIPTYYKTKDYVPYKSPDPLKKDTIAPNWELLSLTDEKISLKSLQGQLVLIDFFYKSCYPCMQALPALQALHEKYKSKGLRIIGIDPYDKKEDDIAAFLAKRGVTYTVLLGGKDAAKDYHVSGYPTMYLIDKTGKIIFTQVGYGKDVEDTLDEIIKNNL